MAGWVHIGRTQKGNHHQLADVAVAAGVHTQRIQQHDGVRPCRLQSREAGPSFSSHRFEGAGA